MLAGSLEASAIETRNDACACIINRAIVAILSGNSSCIILSADCKEGTVSTSVTAFVVMHLSSRNTKSKTSWSTGTLTFLSLVIQHDTQIRHDIARCSLFGPLKVGSKKLKVDLGRCEASIFGLSIPSMPCISARNESCQASPMSFNLGRTSFLRMLDSAKCL